MIESTYSIMSRIGTMEVTTERLIANNKTIYNTAEDFFEKIGPREKWHSSGFEELLIFAATRLSTRDTSTLIEMVSCGNNRIIPTTVRNHLESHGLQMATLISKKAEEALNSEDIKAAFEKEPQHNLFNDPFYLMDPTVVKTAAEKLAVKDYNPADYEAHNESANISVDDICVKAQKPMRPMPEGQEKKKRIDNTVAHFENKDGTYVFNGDGLANVFHNVMGFMAFNNYLLTQPIVFFTDGAKTIHDEIQRTFAFTQHKIILDYYHLSKKFKELFSMAFKGKKISNECHETIMPLLWFGNVDGAIDFMANVDSDKVKNQIYLKQLTDYLNRVRDFIPNYALRKELGLRNGSGIVEKTNDRLVAKRQKHNGMSWSKAGSINLATVTCARVNGEIGDWTQKRIIKFRPVPALDLAA